MKDETDPTEDITELCAIIRSNQMELDLIDKWLSGLDQPTDKMEITRKLLELRSLCLLRSRLIPKIEVGRENLSISGAA